MGLLRLIVILREANWPAGGRRTGAKAAALSASFAGLSALISRTPDDPPQRISTDVARQSGSVPWPVLNKANSLILKIPRRVQFQLRQGRLTPSASFATTILLCTQIRELVSWVRVGTAAPLERRAKPKTMSQSTRVGGLVVRVVGLTWDEPG